MSDKISEERLAQLEASLQEVGNAFGWASISEQLELVRIARRAAEVKPVKLPSARNNKYWYDGIRFRVSKYESAVVAAIKAAGGSVEGEI